MQISSIPVRFEKVWGENAAGAYIRVVPVNSQIGIQDGAASFDTGFVPENFTPVAAGGVPPFGQDFNGLLNTMTAWQQWGQAGGPISYDAVFAAAVGGYPKGAVVASAILQGAQWYSTVDNNTTDPDDPLTSSGWARVGIPAGTPVPFIRAAVATGFVSMMGSFTLGSAASGATYAAADALFLYVENWFNAQLAIYTSGGVLTTRGANAVADFNANKRLAMPDARGASLIGVDSGGSTFLNGVPVVNGAATTPGSTIGENGHTLIVGEVPALTYSGTTGTESASHTHNYTAYQNGPNVAGIGTGGVAQQIVQVTTVTGGENATHTHGFSGSTSGGGGSHNNVERSLTVIWGQKL